MRTSFPCLTCLCLLGGVVLAATSARAQQRQVTTTAILLSEDGAELAEQTVVEMGIRRAVAGIDGLRFRHAGEFFDRRGVSDEVYNGVEELDSIAELVSTGDPDEALSRIRDVLEAFEDNLADVQRANLVDAYMLRALALCQARRVRRCREGMERVVTFRENVVYALPRYPQDHLELFEETRSFAVSNGVRGSLQVTTYPAGAEVFVDGRSIGPSPAVAEGLLVGDHYVTIRAIGFEKVVRRALISATEQEALEVELREAERALFLDTDLPKVRRELGEPRAGRFIMGMRGAGVTSNQIVFGVVGAGEDRAAIDVTLYLYDMRTENLLAQVNGAIEPDVASARELAARLYRGVDLSGHLAPPDDGGEVDDRSTIWGQWWFWTAVGVIAASSVAAVVFLGKEQGQIPEGWIRVEGQIR